MDGISSLNEQVSMKYEISLHLISARLASRRERSVYEEETL
jgi:uncharacterized DUF497 family protein